jgi:hypothetical protein
MMDVEAWEKQLADEGFGDFFVWQDGPGAFYPDHTHSGLTAHIILEGEMTLTSEGQTRTYRAGGCSRARRSFRPDGTERVQVLGRREVNPTCAQFRFRPFANRPSLFRLLWPSAWRQRAASLPADD